MTDQHPLELNKVSISFKDGDNDMKVLDELSFAAKRGEIVAVLGPSGSGKSTFLSIAGILQSPDLGEVLVNGENIVARNDKEKTKIRLNSIGYIFQSSNLLPYLKVEDQLTFILKLADNFNSETKNFVKELLKSVEMEHRAKHYPHQLSGGERQRVAIARAFVNTPDIILADEPTASLDASRSLAIMEIISKVVKEQNKAAIIVTHDERILSYCDRTFYLKNGKLVEKK